MRALAMVDHSSVTGFHISAAYTGVVALLNPAPLVPPVTSTLPFGRIVAFWCRRAIAMDATDRHDGEAALRSMTSAVLVGGSPPPAIRTLPASYMTDDPESR